MSQNRRQDFLINPPFQIAFMGYTVAISLVTSVVFYGAVYYFFWKFKAMGVSAGLPANHVFFRFLAEQQSSMNWYWVVVSLIATTTLCVSGLFISHRVAGPLHNLWTHMLRVASGETDQAIKFREKDLFPELADAYNRQLEAIKERKKAA